MKYLDKDPFSSPPSSKAYRDGWDRIFSVGYQCVFPESEDGLLHKVVLTLKKVDEGWAYTWTIGSPTSPVWEAYKISTGGDLQKAVAAAIKYAEYADIFVEGGVNAKDVYDSLE